LSKHTRTRRPAFAALVATTASLLVAGSLLSYSAAADDDTSTSSQAAEQHTEFSPADLKTQQARAEATGKVVKGEAAATAKDSSKRVEYADGKYAETARTTDRIFVLPVEFGDTVDPAYGGAAGPLHNAIAEPDRTTNTATVWTADYSKSYYQHQIFGDATAGHDTLKSYYQRQSSGAYSITGTVQDWVKVDHSISYYGTDSCKRAGVAISTYYCNEQLVTDGLNTWYAQQLAAGRTAAEVKSYLAKFDQWDRNDYDGDGIYNEPDGYLDHIQIYYAGESQANGGGAYGTDAIGSHKGTVSYLQTGADTLGPDNGNLDGGSAIGDTGIWANDYVMTNENHGLGTIAHEYGHDLGLPDLYDTSGGENSTGFWSVMSNGSLLSSENELSTYPADLGAWAKLQLGWLDYATAEAATAARYTLNPLSVKSSTKGPEAVVVTLPDDTAGNARYYVVENRQYVGEDRYLKSGPYNLGWASTVPNLTEHLNYENGVLIWYWNTKYANNKTKTNSGYGEILPIDAHATPALTTTGATIRNRLQSYDAPFALHATKALTFHLNGVEQTIPSQPGVPTFDDTNGTYHYATNPYGSSYDADSGTTITVTKEYGDGRVGIAVGASS
jgi:M6 family metalloprotease-like protein